MQTGYKHQNTIKIDVLFPAKSSGSLDWLDVPSTKRSFVNNRFIAAPCFKANNGITLDVCYWRVNVVFSLHSVQAKHNK